MHFPLHEDLGDFYQNNGATIVRHIASFMSLSDAASMGTERVASWSSFNLTTPETPGLMALSPYENDTEGVDSAWDEDEQDALHVRLADRQRKYVTQKLAAAVFSHPQSLRSFCVKAHQAAADIAKSRSPETWREPPNKPNIFKFLIKSALQNVPLSVLWNLLDVAREVGLDTSFAVVTITVDSINGLIEAVMDLLERLWNAVTKFHFSSASEVLVSGIQSVGDAALLHRTPGDTFENKVANQKLIEKLSQINAAALVINYREGEDQALTRHAKKRIERMMHYNVSLRPFLATIALEQERQETFGNVDFPNHSSALPSPNTTPPSPFMCTPKSFPPTPASRSLVLARGTKFAEDVIFLARDKLRVEDGLDSDNERTRAMAVALRNASRLAVFNAADAGNGIMLTCGQHVATKVGNVLYCSTRSMVPVLRNCFAYFEMTVLPRGQMTSLSVGLSTLEMPLNTLVGAWKGSVGLATTGQILTAGQWALPLEVPEPYGENATVGCLVCLDDGSAFETWDGVMVTANVTFNVNGRRVLPPVGENQHDSTSPTLPLLVPMEEELFPTLTLHSPGTQVMCRFSSEDIMATSREEIGAPSGVPIYAVDGSVLFQSSDE